MPSTYSTNLAIELIANGEQDGTWGTTTNRNLGTLLEQAISGYVAQAISDAGDTTITIPNGATGVARNMFVEGTGALTGARNLIVPANKKLYFFYNNTTGGFAVTVKVSGQTGVAVPAGAKMLLVSNGTDVVAATNYMASLTLGSVLTVPYGGSGAATFTANNVLLGNGTSAFQVVAPGSSGNVLTSNGTTWVAQAPTAPFTAGMIMLWSGSIGTIPSGWVICDGTNSTPDLRDRFVVGAGSTYAVNATGGSANAIVVTHSHGVTDPTHIHAGSYVSSAGGQNIGSASAPAVTISTGIAAAATGISVDSAGSSGTNANLPPYYALAYIMKT